MATGGDHPRSPASASASGRGPALLLAALLGAASLVVLALSTLLTVAFTDYEEEALPSVTALVHGDVGGFLAALPAYGGSLVLRAPAALGADALGGGELAVYRALALPCLAAALIFALVLFTHLHGRRAGLAAWLGLAVVVANPVLIPALDTGHPEELLGAVLCAGAVAAALRDRPLLAGVLLGVAGANKAWALLAVVPALIALRRGHLTLLLSAGALCALVLAPAFVQQGGTRVAGTQTATDGTGAIFQPWQWTWFAGHHGDVVRGVYGEKAGFRTGPAWVTQLGHLPVVVLPILLALAAWVVRRVDRGDALLVLALCFLVRCVVDPWDTAYYHLPFLMALAAHEVLARHRAPVLSIAATAAVYASTVLARDRLAPDAQAVLYLLWSVPAMAALLAGVFAPARLQGLRITAQSMTVRAFGRPLSTSCPSSVTTTRSSMRTPTAPGT
jgi:hypothetical protein